jgi:hypothetical protein
LDMEYSIKSLVQCIIKLKSMLYKVDTS